MLGKLNDFHEVEQMTCEVTKADRNPPDPVHQADINYEEGGELFMRRWTTV